MGFSKKEKSVIEKALAYWEANKLIDSEQAEKLQEQLPTKGFDWKSLAYYTSIFALVSLVIAVISIFADEALLKLIDSLIESSYLTKTIFGLLISALFFYLDVRYSHKSAEGEKKNYSKEVFSLLAAISMAITTGFSSFLIGLQEKPGVLILCLSIIYLTFGKLQLKQIYWLFGLVALLIGFGSLTVEWASENDAFLGMNFPMRYSLLGALLIGLTLAFRQFLHPFFNATYNLSVILFFVSLWILSISGNYHTYNDWLEARQYELWFYSILLFIASGAAVILGLKKEDSLLKYTGIIFIFINLYTRYFEYFWDSLHKAVFFLILAISFWLIGKRAEKLLNK